MLLTSSVWGPDCDLCEIFEKVTGLYVRFSTLVLHECFFVSLQLQHSLWSSSMLVGFETLSLQPALPLAS